MLSHSSQTQGGHKNREIVYALPTLNTSLCLAVYIGRKTLPKSYWEVKHNGIDYQAWRYLLCGVILFGADVLNQPKIYIENPAESSHVSPHICR